MKHRIFALSFLLLTACLFQLLLAQAANPYQATISEFEALVEKEIAERQLVGFSAAFSFGAVQWARGFGYADLENRVEATELSSYRMASVSKPMTAVGILELVEQGKVDLDAEVQRYVPDFPRKKWPVTVRQLLGHLGGISHYKDYPREALTVKEMNTAEALAIFQDWDLLHEPGSRYQYTTYGYNLLWAVIEGASGQSYADFMRENVWGPLEMENTTVDYLYRLIPNRVRGYRRVNGEIENTIPVSTSLKIGGGGTRATVLDMVRFARGLSAGKVLEGSTRREMWTSMVTNDGRNTGYGMGWGISTDNGRFSVNHSGGQEGTRTYLLHFPGADLTIAMASNFENSNPGRFARILGEMLLAVPKAFPAPYLANDADRLLFVALEASYRQGLAYRDWQRRPFSADPERVKDAFAYLGRFSGNEDYARLLKEVADGNHPLTGMPYLTAGSFAAATLADAGYDPEKLQRMGSLAFFESFFSLAEKNAGGGTVPGTEIRSRVSQWHADRQAVWGTELAHLEIGPGSDPAVLRKTLVKAFGKHRTYPDYSQELGAAAIGAEIAGDSPRAEKLGKLALDLYPADETGNGVTGLILTVRGKGESGLKLLRKSLAMDPAGFAGPDNLNSLAYRFFREDQVDKGLRLLGAAVALHPADPNLYDSQGEFYLSKGDTASAIRFYEKALQVDPQFANARYMLEQIRGQ